MNEEREVTYLGDVQRLCLKPGDIVVLNIDEVLSDQAFDRLRDRLVETMPGHRVLILTHGAKIGVLGNDE